MTSYGESSVPDQSGKTLLITGANTGIGYEAARVLAGRGARILLGCRTESKANDAIGKIQSIHPDADLAWVALDLTRLSSVAEAAEIVMREPHLDVIVNNAGVMIPPLTRTEEGFELQFGVNHLGHFALTRHLIGKLAATPGSRVVNVSSGAHVGGRIDFDDPHAERSYVPLNRYNMSKAANLYFTLELSRRLASAGVDVTSLACHPGVADTDLSRTFPIWLSWALPILRPIFNTPAEGALPTLMAATLPGAPSNAYYGPTKLGGMARSAGPAKMASHIRDEDVARKLWDLSEQLTGAKYELT